MVDRAQFLICFLLAVQAGCRPFVVSQNDPDFDLLELVKSSRKRSSMKKYVYTGQNSRFPVDHADWRVAVARRRGKKIHSAYSERNMD